METALSVSQKLHATKVGFAAVWLRHAPAPLLWIHPNAKNRVLMPDGDSNAIFDSSGIFIVGTCPPMKMDTNLLFRQSVMCPLWRAHFFIGQYILTAVLKPSPFGGRWRACAPDEGEVSGKHPLISHLR